MAADQLNRSVQVYAGFLMDRNPVRSGIHKRRNVLVRFSIIKWQSSGRFVTFLTLATTGGPIVIFGTK